LPGGEFSNTPHHNTWSLGVIGRKKLDFKRMNESGIIILAFIVAGIFFVKMELHKYLDKKNGYSKKPSNAMMLHPIFLLPYFQKTTLETKQVKIWCNIVYGIFLLMTAILIMNRNV